jgi:hypothetical protein
MKIQMVLEKTKVTSRINLNLYKEYLEDHKLFKVVQSMKGSGLMKCEMELENKDGLMDRNTRVNGKKTRLMEEEN